MQRTKFLAATAVCGLLLSIGVGTARAADPCDRACLEGHVDQVLAAMIAHNPSQLMLARNVRYTEDGIELRIGDGLWRTATARGKYKLYVADPEAGQIGYYGTLSENGAMDYLALRLKVTEALIGEIEVIVARPSEMPGSSGAMASAGQALEQKGQPRPEFLQTVPPAERMSRQKLIEIANSYFTGLANQTGKTTAPFAPTCERWEDGMQTTNQKPNPNPAPGAVEIVSLGCEDQQKTGWFAFVTDIRDRRYPIVDIERGLVMSFGFFDHNAAVRSYPMANGQMTPNILRTPTTLEISELFEIRQGKIDQIEAVINTVPYAMRSEVWDK
jgi:hypothetical protein